MSLLLIFSLVSNNYSVLALSVNLSVHIYFMFWLALVKLIFASLRHSFTDDVDET